jgi:hypothetical protein
MLTEYIEFIHLVLIFTIMILLPKGSLDSHSLTVLELGF